MTKFIISELMEIFFVNRQSRIKNIVIAMFLMFSSLGFGQIGNNTVDWGVHPMDFSRVGSAGWQFLKLPTDARSAAMGGVKSALGYGNSGSALTNPASTVDVKDMDIQFSTMTWVADIKYNTISFVKTVPEIGGTLGINCIYVNYGDMIRTEVKEGFGPSGNSLGVIPITEGLGTFGAHDLSLGLLYSQQITEALQVGGTLSYLEEQIDDATMRSWALNLGTIYWTGLGSLRISMLGRNFGSDGEFKEFAGRQALSPALVRLPMEFVIGAAYDVMNEAQHRVTVAAEYVKPNDGPDKYNFGLEYFAFSNMYVRGGMRFNYDESSFDVNLKSKGFNFLKFGKVNLKTKGFNILKFDSAYSLGFGIQYGVSENYGVKFDYAYTDVGRFQAVHVLTCGFTF